MVANSMWFAPQLHLMAISSLIYTITRSDGGQFNVVYTTTTSHGHFKSDLHHNYISLFTPEPHLLMANSSYEHAICLKSN